MSLNWLVKLTHPRTKKLALLNRASYLIVSDDNGLILTDSEKKR